MSTEMPRHEQINRLLSALGSHEAREGAGVGRSGLHRMIAEAHFPDTLLEREMDGLIMDAVDACWIRIDKGAYRTTASGFIKAKEVDDGPFVPVIPKPAPRWFEYETGWLLRSGAFAARVWKAEEGKGRLEVFVVDSDGSDTCLMARSMGEAGYDGLKTDAESYLRHLRDSLKDMNL